VTRSPQAFEIALTAIEGGLRGRRMELGHIGGLAIFLANLRRPVVLRLGDIRLRH
jgi:hypothetical protein